MYKAPKPPSPRQLGKLLRPCLPAFFALSGPAWRPLFVGDIDPAVRDRDIDPAFRDIDPDDLSG